MSKQKTSHNLDTGNFIPATLSEKQVADLMGVSVPTLHKWIEKGMQLETVKFNGFDTRRYETRAVLAALGQDKINRIYQENLINFKQKGGFG